jgi:hypothetical protein
MTEKMTWTGDDVTCVIPSVNDAFRNMIRMEARASVGAQTVKPKKTLMSVDDQCGWTGSHLAANRNRLIDLVDTEFYACLDDDDVFYKDHIATLLSAANERPEAHVIYSWGDGRGQSVWTPWDPEVFLEHNIICSTIMCRKSAWYEVGGYPEDEDGYEDYLFLKDILEVFGPTAFCCVPRVTWHYRQTQAPSLTGPNRAKPRVNH